MPVNQEQTSRGNQQAFREWVSLRRVKRSMAELEDSSPESEMVERRIRNQERILGAAPGDLSPLWKAIQVEVAPGKNFSSARAFRSYAGLAPRGNRGKGIYLREPCASNLWLRRALEEYAETAMEASSELRYRYQQKLATHSREIALREISRVVAGWFLRARNRFNESSASPGRKNDPLAEFPALEGDSHPGDVEAVSTGEKVIFP